MACTRAQGPIARHPCLCADDSFTSVVQPIIKTGLVDSERVRRHSHHRSRSQLGVLLAVQVTDLNGVAL
jgi:hypothetical protein